MSAATFWIENGMCKNCGAAVERIYSFSNEKVEFTDCDCMLTEARKELDFYVDAYSNACKERDAYGAECKQMRSFHDLCRQYFCREGRLG